MFSSYAPRPVAIDGLFITCATHAAYGNAYDLPMSIPYAPALSENDILRVAPLVKNVLKDEIACMVILKVQQVTEYLNAEISDLKRSNSALKNELDDLKSKMMN